VVRDDIIETAVLFHSWWWCSQFVSGCGQTVGKKQEVGVVITAHVHTCWGWWSMRDRYVGVGGVFIQSVAISQQLPQRSDCPDLELIGMTIAQTLTNIVEVRRYFDKP
jgi:hypothetical protein